MNNSRPTQCDRIKKYIEDFGSITTLEAFTELGVVRLGARISEMRANGPSTRFSPFPPSFSASRSRTSMGFLTNRFMV